MNGKSNASATRFVNRNGIFSLYSKPQKSKEYISWIEKDLLIPKKKTAEKNQIEQEIHNFESERLNC